MLCGYCDGTLCRAVTGVAMCHYMYLPKSTQGGAVYNSRKQQDLCVDVTEVCD